MAEISVTTHKFETGHHCIYMGLVGSRPVLQVGKIYTMPNGKFRVKNNTATYVCTEFDSLEAIIAYTRDSLFTSNRMMNEGVHHVSDAAWWGDWMTS